MANKKRSPLRVHPLAIFAIGAVVGGMLGKKSKKNKGLDAAQDKFNKYMKQFEETEFKPLDLDKLRQENVYEERDITKDILPSYDLATQSFIQSQQNIMQAFKKTAGASGVAGLAQSMSQQGQQFAGQTRAGLAKVLGSRADLALQEQSRLQNLMTKYEVVNQQGAAQFEQDKLATLMGVQGQQIAGIRGAIANQQQANATANAAMITAVAMMAGASDRRLKKNIKKIGTSPSGLGIYEFEFKDKVYGEGKYQGAMADEVPSEAKITNADGYEEVYYDKIDVDFKKV